MFLNTWSTYNALSHIHSHIHIPWNPYSSWGLEASGYIQVLWYHYPLANHFQSQGVDSGVFCCRTCGLNRHGWFSEAVEQGRLWLVATLQTPCFCCCKASTGALVVREVHPCSVCDTVDRWRLQMVAVNYGQIPHLGQNIQGILPQICKASDDWVVLR